MPLPIPYSPLSQNILEHAEAIAVARGEERITPADLLVALSSTRSGAVYRTLDAFGLAPAAAEAWLETAVGPLSIPSTFDEANPCSQRMVAILAMAQAEASEAESPEVRPQDLLLGIVREPFAANGAAGAALLARGATYHALRASLT